MYLSRLGRLLGARVWLLVSAGASWSLVALFLAADTRVAARLTLGAFLATCG